jgi:hypothetical protein
MLDTICNTGRVWTDHDEADLADMLAKKTRVSEMARRLGRTENAVRTKISNLGGYQTAPTSGMRKCLGPMCLGRRTFLSSGPGERICPSCRKRAGMRCA